MENLDTFLTLAEISVAFLGFSGVVSVFLRREDSLWVKGTIYRMRLMLEVSISALLFSFLPLALNALEFPRDYFWQFIGVSALAYLIITFVIYAKRAKVQAKVKRENFSPLVQNFLIVSVAALTIGLTLRLLGVWDVPGAGLHTAFVMFLLASAALYFFRMLFFVHAGGKNKNGS